MKLSASLAGLLLAVSSAAALAQSAPAGQTTPPASAPAAAAPAAPAQETAPEIRVARPIEMMLTQQAASLSFDGKVLTLQGVAPTAAFAIDRPERIGGTMTTEQFVKMWNATVAMMKNDPPNVALTTLGPVPTQAIVELGAASLSGSTLSFNTVVLDGTVPPSGQLVSLTTQPTVFRPMKEVHGFLKCWWSPYWAQRVCRADW